jgi:hypothetical protein
MMEPDLDTELETRIDSELKKLPFSKAPASLAPRVLSILAARARMPWWHRAWWDWPLAAQAAFLVVALAIAGGFSGGTLILDQNATAYSQQMSERLAPITGLGQIGMTLANAFGLLWDKAAQPFVLYGLALAGSLYLICLGLGTVCVRYALKRS